MRLSNEVWPLLSTEGHTGARDMIRSDPALFEEMACAGDPADIDALDDLARWDQPLDASSTSPPWPHR